MAQIGALVSFTAGTTIVSADVNSNFSAIRTAFNDTAMLTDVARTVTVSHSYSAVQKFADGTESDPGIQFVNDANSGLYRIGANNIGLTLDGTKRWDFAAAGSTLTGTLTVSGAAALQSTLAVTGNATVGGTLGVTGAVTGGTYNGQTVSAAASLTGSLAVATTLAVTGAVTLSSTLAVTGAATFSGSVTAANFKSATISNSTTDGNDTSSLDLCGGGATATSRGALLVLYGNENGAAGDANLSAGNVAGSAVSLITADTVRLSVAFDGLTTISYGLQLANQAPAALANGQIWYDGTNLKARLAGATVTIQVA